MFIGPIGLPLSNQSASISEDFRNHRMTKFNTNSTFSSLGGDAIPPGTFHGGDAIPPGTFH